MFLRGLGGLIDILGMSIIWMSSLFAGFAWLTVGLDYPRWLGTGIFILLVVAAATYDTGYKRYLKAGRRWYFTFVFALPLGLGVIGMSAGICYLRA